MDKSAKMYNKLNNAFRDAFTEAFYQKFGIAIEMSFSLGAMALVSTRLDGKKFNKQQAAFMKAYEDGYVKAMEIASSH